MNDVSLITYDSFGLVELRDQELVAAVRGGSYWTVEAGYSKSSNHTCGTDINGSCANPNGSCIVGINNVCGQNDHCAGIAV